MVVAERGWAVNAAVAALDDVLVTTDPAPAAFGARRDQANAADVAGHRHAHELATLRVSRPASRRRR
jgi:hypothetical protein